MQVLRTTFFVLVLGNLLLFVWGQGYLGNKGGGESERLSAQIEPDKLRIAGIGTPPTSVDPPREECRALSGLDPSTALTLVAMLGARDAQIKITQHPLEEPRAWWVNIPPQPNSAQADRKAAELSKLRIRDFYVVRESGPNQYSLSLGLFKNEESAKEYLDFLQKKGVKSARIQAREAASDKIVVEVRGMTDKLTKVLADLPAELNAPAPTACSKP
jgi:SPOR domain